MSRTRHLLAAARRPARWFLPGDADVLGALRSQMAITVEGIAAFATWCAAPAEGAADAAERVRASEHAADTAKRAVRMALRDAFITPVSPEDIFSLSELIDKVLNQAKDVVREAEVMDMAPDAAMAEMAEHIHLGVEHLATAVASIEAHGGNDGGRSATEAADAATKSARRMEKVYRGSMSDLLQLEHHDPLRSEDVREVIGRRELYRRLSRIAESVAEVADRVWYASVKES